MAAANAREEVDAEEGVDVTVGVLGVKASPEVMRIPTGVLDVNDFLQSSKIKDAPKEHILRGNAAGCEALYSPSAFFPMSFSLWRWQHALGRGPW